MFLKSIEMLGFKSFADRTRIEFTDGISALLGPNGCGKSNVVDSIKWVLGEQATKTLRADKMEDVIFNGTEARRAMNVAEVTLTIANEEGVLELDVPEVSIKRRLYRSGESEYFINSTPVKLKELRELFFDTGVGKSAYSIMEQGKIDQILSNKPEERRYIFEEAAGITRFKAKGQEAERKLQRTEDNVLQVRNILTEVKRRYDSLQVQSKKTEQYRQIKKEIFDVELDSHLVRLKKFQAEKKSKEEINSGHLIKQGELKEWIDSINSSLEENLDIVNTMEHSLIEDQKNLYGIDLEKENLEARKKIHQNTLSENQTIIESLNQKLKGFTQKIDEINKERQQKIELGMDLEKRAKDSQIHIEEFTHSIDMALERINKNEELSVDYQTEIDQLDLKQEEFQNHLRSLTDDIVYELDKGLVGSGYSWKERKLQEEEFLRTLETITISLLGKKDRLSDMRVLESADRNSIVLMLKDVSDSLESIFSSVESFKEKFDFYIQSTPVFLDEFLSPEGIITKKRELDAQISENTKKVKDFKDKILACQNQNKELSVSIEQYRKTLEDLKISSARLTAQTHAVSEALTVLDRELVGQENLFQETKKEIEANKQKTLEIKTLIEELDKQQKEIILKEKELKKGLEKLKNGISSRNKELLGKRDELEKKTRQYGKTQVEAEKVQLDLARIDTELKNLYDNFEENYSRNLGDFLDRMDQIESSLSDLRTVHAEKKTALRGLGHVNLMAPEEYAEVKERYEFLVGQLDDLSRAREDLKRITLEIKKESSELFKVTYNQIKKNFHVMFRQLFGGGRAELKLIVPEDLLGSGIEILAQPPGKRLENIALLSGGERSLTAVALLFATYKVKPSPFCILDEIDAALDESNVGRFVNTLMEFGHTSQFIVITHNKKTVAGAKTLLGVTMQESGISKIIAIRLGDENEKDQNK